MNLCLFTPTFLPKIGGLEIALDTLARRFQQRGHDVLVLAKTPRGRPVAPDLPYPVVYYPRHGSNVWSLGKAARALLAEHAKRRFDVVHAHMVYPAGYVAVSLRARLGVPVVITSHSADITPGARFRRRWIPRRRMRWAMRHADAVTGVNRVLKEIIDEMTGGRANARMIPNGVTISAGAGPDVPADLVDLAERPFLLALCRLHWIKGLDVLLRAVRRLRDEGRPACHLVIAGTGREEGRLRRMAGELGLAGAVRFVGAAVGDRKEWLLHHCRFLVHSSISYEGLPLSILEAMAHGKSVVATAIPGTLELVDDGVEGLLVPPSDPIALAEAIGRMHESRRDGRIEGFQRSARRRAEGMSWDAVVDQYLALYEELPA